MSRPTLDEIAKLAGVSPATVSLVLNEKGSIGEETRLRVKQIILEVGYIRRPSSRRMGLMGSVPQALITSLRQAAAEYGYELQVIPKGADGAFVAPYSNFGGIIIYGGIWDPLLIKQIINRYPTILLGGHAHHVYVDSVWVDNVDGIEQAVSYLVERGHLGIGLVNGPVDTLTSWEKETGFRRALSLVGKSVVGTTVNCTAFSTICTYRAMEELMTKAGKGISAVIAAETISGLAVRDFLEARDIVVPSGMSIIVFRDGPSLSQAHPSLTAIGFSSLDISREAVNCLVRRINDPISQAKRILFKPYIIERGSVAVRK